MLQTFLFSRAFSLPYNTACPSASEVTTLWRYTNAFIIIITTPTHAGLRRYRWFGRTTPHALR